MAGNWFVALSVPAVPWFSRVPESPHGVRLFHPDDLHITVAFLGACGEEAAQLAFDVAPKWPTSTVDVTLGAVEPMGNPRRPSAFASLVSDGAGTLRDAIVVVRDEMCARAGARLDERAPRPHVTIARPRRSATGPERKEAATWARSVVLRDPCIRLSRLVLYGHSTDPSVRLFRDHAMRELGSRSAER